MANPFRKVKLAEGSTQTFGNFEQRGGSIVLGRGDFKSPNFATNEKGWRVDSDGNAEFQSVILEGENITNIINRVNSLFNKFTFLGNWKDTLTETVTSSTITRRIANTDINNSNADNATGQLGNEANIGFSDNAGGAFNWNNDYDLHVVAMFSNITTGKAGFGLGSTVIPGTDALTQTGEHFSFYVLNGILYASNADGSTEKRTIISGITTTTLNRYRIVYTGGTDVKYYVNEILQATHTANLPTGATNFKSLTFHVRNPTSGTSTNRMVFTNSYTVQCDP